MKHRLDVIAVDTRNCQATLELFRCTYLCTMPVKVYKFIPRQRRFGWIRHVDTTLSNGDIVKHLCLLEERVSAIRRLGTTSTLMITFYGTTLPKYVYLGHVLHLVSAFEDRPVQCRNCWDITTALSPATILLYVVVVVEAIRRVSVLLLRPHTSTVAIRIMRCRCSVRSESCEKI